MGYDDDISRVSLPRVQVATVAASYITVMSSDESDSDLPRAGCDACRKKKTKCYSAKMRDYCCTNCRAPMGRPRSTIGSYDAVSWDPLLWKKWRGPCAGAPDLVFLPQLPEVCPLDELAWNVARERYHKQWDAAHLVLKKAEKEFKAWEQEQWKPRADGMSVVYFRPADPSKCDRYMPHALKIPDGDSNLSYRWIDLHTLTGPEVTKIFEDNAVTDELNDRQEQWETTQFPISYVQMVILRNLPPRMEIWRPNCRNYPLGRIMESLTEEERHRALTLCLEVAITAARELIQPKKLSDALMKRCRGDLRKLKEDVGCHRYPTAKRIITTLLTVYHLSRTPHEAERAVTWYDKMAAVSTSCVYYADIDRGETDECRCYCQFKRLRRELPRYKWSWSP
ncbi:hypothetical protein BDZ89DRAFT_620312 [Hymenopellis radicata]|nr:hypothetical protein BDZ89DRAFT_620312 [Hymenopellis radicata]